MSINKKSNSKIEAMVSGSTSMQHTEPDGQAPPMVVSSNVASPLSGNKGSEDTLTLERPSKLKELPFESNSESAEGSSPKWEAVLSSTEEGTEHESDGPVALCSSMVLTNTESKSKTDVKSVGSKVSAVSEMTASLALSKSSDMPKRIVRCTKKVVETEATKENPDVVLPKYTVLNNDCRKRTVKVVKLINPPAKRVKYYKASFKERKEVSRVVKPYHWDHQGLAPPPPPKHEHPSWPKGINVTSSRYIRFRNMDWTKRPKEEFDYLNGFSPEKAANWINSTNGQSSEGQKHQIDGVQRETVDNIPLKAPNNSRGQNKDALTLSSDVKATAAGTSPIQRCLEDKVANSQVSRNSINRNQGPLDKMSEEINSDRYLDRMSFEDWAQKLENDPEVKSEIKNKILDTLRDKNTSMVKELKSNNGKYVNGDKRWRSMIDDVADLRKKVDQTRLQNEFYFKFGLTSLSENQELQTQLEKSKWMIENLERKCHERELIIGKLKRDLDSMKAKEMDEYLVEIEQLKEKNKNLADRNKAAENKAKTFVTEINAVTNQLTQSQKLCVSHEMNIYKLKKTVELSDLPEKELIDRVVDFEKLEERTKELEEENQRLQRKIECDETDLAFFKEDNEELEKKNRELQAEVEMHQEEVERRAKTVKYLEEQSEKAIQIKEELGKEVELLAETHDTNNQNYNALWVRNAKLKKTVQILQKKRPSVKRKIINSHKKPVIKSYHKRSSRKRSSSRRKSYR